MQLQHLCSIRLEAAIRSQLGQLPRTLHTLYANVYDMLSNRSDEIERVVFRRTLCLLLCAQREIETAQFLDLVASSSHVGVDAFQVTKDLVLEFCNNLIVFDAQLDTFRFAHLSVREFLEERQEYCRSGSNALITEACLWNLIDKKSISDKFRYERKYSVLFWPVHYQLAAEKRTSESLKRAFQTFCTQDDDGSCPIELWNTRISENYFMFGTNRKLSRCLRETQTRSASCPVITYFVACAFDLPELLEDLGNLHTWPLESINLHGRLPHVVSTNVGSCAALEYLLNNFQESLQVLEEMVITAAHSESNKEMMELLLDQRGDRIKVTEAVVQAAAMYGNGDLMALLLDRRGDEIQITEAVVQGAASNKGGNGVGVMTILFDRRPGEVTVTEAILQAAINRNWNEEIMATLLKRWDGWNSRNLESAVETIIRAQKNVSEFTKLILDIRGGEFKISEAILRQVARSSSKAKRTMELLLDRRGNEIKITETLVEAAAENPRGEAVMKLLLDRRGDEIKITESIIEAVAANRRGGPIMKLLLDRRDDEIKITESVIEAAARNAMGKFVMKLLLDRRGNEVKKWEKEFQLRQLQYASQNGFSNNLIISRR